MQLTYFPLWAKGPGPALALAHSGLRWRGVFPEDWASLKPQTAWSKLPILQVDNGPSSLTVAHELAIMSYIGRAVPEMGGTTDSDLRHLIPASHVRMRGHIRKAHQIPANNTPAREVPTT